MTELEKAAASICFVHPDWSKLECFRIGFKEGAEWQSKHSPWISVEDRLPEEYKDVFAKYSICGETKYDILFIYGSAAWCFTNMEEYIDESMIVTHWMPIPE